ncbi:MAG: AAA family ATPase [Pseudomonadota bacterium]
MMTAPKEPEMQPMRACTISRDIQVFDMLIEDMEAALGQAWGDLTFTDALAYLSQPEARGLDFIALALDDADQDRLPQALDIVRTAVGQGIRVILVAEDLGTAALHQLMRAGAAEFIPYPLPEGELAEAIARLEPAPEPELPPAQMRTTLEATGDYNGAIFAVHGLAGGTGASTLAVNLAWELANIDRATPPRVCLIDLDLQFGAASTYLDLPRRDAVLEMLQDTESMDSESFMTALLAYEEKLHVLTAPSDMVPLDLIGPEDVSRVLDTAAANFDYVVVDMPTTLVQWTETVLEAAHVYFCMIELDMRSAQNAVRLKKALQAEELPFDKTRFVVNRGPKRLDLTGRSRIKTMAESLAISIDIQLPDGGKVVTQASDHGLPLAEAAAKSPLRKEIQTLAASLHAINLSDEKAA